MLPLSILLFLLSSLLPLGETGEVSVVLAKSGPQCTVTAIGQQQNDVPNILKAFHECGKSGTIIFPEEENYWIAEKLNPNVNDDVVIDWKGQWTFSDDIDYWRNNSYHIEFQNHAAGFVLTGTGIQINGHGTGGINGNGDAWYTQEAGTTQPGRPMPFVFWNTSDVLVENFFVKQPPLWSINIMNGTNMTFNNIRVNATATKAPSGKNWVQNTDGFDTMDARNIWLNNFTYTGGDDCIAIKPRSYDIFLNNITYNGGNGVAVGSLGQYLEDSSVENVLMTNVNILRSRYGAYIKTWMGELVPQESYESAGQPRGGGWGTVHNITHVNFNVTGSARPLNIGQDQGNNGSFAGTSKMEISDVVYSNFFGTLSGEANTASISCSTVHPCSGIYFTNMDQKGTGGAKLKGTCKYTSSGGIHGLSGC